ncbi:MAG: leucine-rich repeat protein [Promethearchaeota archaeon]
MELDPDFIKENLIEIGKKEGLILLKEFIENSTERLIRRKALEYYGELEDGKNFNFFENIFFSDEDLEMRLIAGKVLKTNYSTHKKLISLLEYALKKMGNMEQKIFSLRTLHSIDSIKVRKIIMEYMKSIIKTRFKNNVEGITEVILKYDYKNNLPESLIEICTNLILNDYYVNVCGFLSTLRKGRIVSLDCESLAIKRIRDITGIKNLNDLEHLNIQRTKIRYLDDLHHFKNLKYLNLSYNTIQEIENLSSLADLEELDLSYNKISKIINLESLNKLKKLSLANNMVKEIENLDSLVNLEDLNLAHNKIMEIKNLENQVKLKKINLSSNRIEKLTGFEGLTNLIWLSVNNNRISQITGLSSLSNLRLLYISNNQVEKIEGLDNLLNLRKLELSNNRISYLEGLENLPELQELYLDDNSIEKLDGLDYLKNLIILHIGRNKITQFRSDDIKNQTNLNFLFLNENPLDQQSWEHYSKRFRFP